MDCICSFNNGRAFLLEMPYNINMKQIKIVKLKDKGKRLDKFLAEHFSNYSRSYFQKLIKDRKVLVNKKKASAHNILEENDEVTIELAKPRQISLEPDSNIKLNVVFEDNDFLVINKQSGIAVHPAQSNPDRTLVNGILARYPKIASVGDDSFRPGIVHRLDKDVSGLIVVAKTQQAFLHLKELFQKRAVHKKYLALVHGKLNQSEGKIESNIGRSKRHPHRMSIKQGGQEKDALTYFRVLKEYEHYTLLEIETKTGRTHQIRVHLHSLGNPIAGDKIYQIKSIKPAKELNRIFLHAGSIQFTGISGEVKKFSADFPEELEDFLLKLKNPLT